MLMMQLQMSDEDGISGSRTRCVELYFPRPKIIEHIPSTTPQIKFPFLVLRLSTIGLTSAILKIEHLTHATKIIRVQST